MSPLLQRKEGESEDEKGYVDFDNNPVPATGSRSVVLPTPADLPKMREEFRAQFNEVGWIDQGEAGFRLGLQLAMGDPEDAGKELESRSVKNLRLLNKVHSVTEIALSESSYAGDSAGPDFYAVVSAVDDNGEQFSYSIGGWIPLGQLRAKAVGGAFPWRCQIVGKATDKGNPAYRYVDA